ncbi:unnamed protein product [Staurois parvus]|uniref:Uncharacterized protein n=1 Tax=Staurois parvus TaxID=386267 RepID=A0ABN9FH43_9NEOB|nr:unnamed protein product [Staurois parvus]
MYIHTHKNTHMYMHTHTHLNTHTYMYIHADTCTIVHAYTDTHTCTLTHTPLLPHKKLQYFVVHSQIRVLHSRGRQRAQHTLLALLSLRSAIEQSDGSQCQ